MKEDIKTRNSKNKYHGYQQLYIQNHIRYRGNWKNDTRIGYTEYHLIENTRYYII